MSLNFSWLEAKHRMPHTHHLGVGHNSKRGLIGPGAVSPEQYSALLTACLVSLALSR